MAYMDQAKKAKIAEALRAVMPASFKYSLSVRNHSTLCLTIRSAPVDILGAIAYSEKVTHFGINVYHVERQFKPYGLGMECAALFGRIRDAMNTGNHDRSDVMTDYFDVGHYIEINIGAWNKPFEVK